MIQSGIKGNSQRIWAIGLCIWLLVICFGGCRGKAKEEVGESVGPIEVESSPGQMQEAHSPELGGELVVGVLMEVDQEVITTSDALNALAEPLRELGQRSPAEQFRVQAKQLIVKYLRGRMAEILLVNEARNGLSEQESSQVEARKEAYRARLLRESFNSQTRLEKKLRREGKTLEGELDKYERQLQVRMFLSNQFANRINIIREDIVSYYGQQSRQYHTPRKVELLRIQVLDYKHSEPGESSEQVRERVRARVQEAWDELATDRPFSVVAMKYSDVRAEQGGNWGVVDPMSLQEAGEREAAQTLGTGEFSRVLDTELGCCIVGVGRIVPAQQRTLEEVQEEIRQALWEKQYNRLYNERLSELGRRAVITASPLALRMVVDLAQQQFAPGS